MLHENFLKIITKINNFLLLMLKSDDKYMQNSRKNSKVKKKINTQGKTQKTLKPALVVAFLL